MHNDLELLQGTWSITSLEVEGQPMPEPMLSGAQITINGERFTSSGMGEVYKGTLMINPSADPPQFPPE